MVRWKSQRNHPVITVHGLVAVQLPPLLHATKRCNFPYGSQLKTGTGAPLIGTGAGRNSTNTSLRLLLSLLRPHADKMRLQAWDVTTRQSTTQTYLASPMTKHSHMQYLRFLTKPNYKVHSSARCYVADQETKAERRKITSTSSSYLLWPNSRFLTTPDSKEQSSAQCYVAVQELR